MQNADNTPRSSPRPPQDVDRFDPVREPDWRFNRIFEIVDHEPQPLRSKTTDDEYVREMKSFILAYRAPNGISRKKHYTKFPGPYHAWQIHQASRPETPLLVKCRILAGQTNLEIANMMGATPEAIDWYEKIFFHVRDRLDFPDWIVTHVLNPAQEGHHGVNAIPLMTFAYFGGPQALEYLISGFPGKARPQGPDDVGAFVMDAVMAGMARRGALAVNTFRANDKQVLQLLGMVARQQAARKTGDGLSMPSELIQAVRAFLNKIKFSKGSEAAKEEQRTAPDLYEADNLAAELRDDEIYEMANGNSKELLADLKAMKFPEARRGSEQEGPT